MTHNQAAKALYAAEHAVTVSLNYLRNTPAASFEQKVEANIATLRQKLDTLKQAVREDDALHGGANTWHTKANALMLRSVQEEANAIIADAESLLARYKSAAAN